MAVVRWAGLLAVFLEVALALLEVSSLVLVAVGLSLITIARLASREVDQPADLMVAAAGLLMLAVSGLQPMYWLIPSIPLIAGVLLVLLSGAWRPIDQVIGLVLVPVVLLVGATVVVLLWFTAELPGPHGPVVAVFYLASLYGPVSMVALLVVLLVRHRSAVPEARPW